MIASLIESYGSMQNIVIVKGDLFPDGYWAKIINDDFASFVAKLDENLIATQRDRADPNEVDWDWGNAEYERRAVVGDVVHVYREAHGKLHYNAHMENGRIYPFRRQVIPIKNAERINENMCVPCK